MGARVARQARARECPPQARFDGSQFASATVAEATGLPAGRVTTANSGAWLPPVA